MSNESVLLTVRDTSFLSPYSISGAVNYFMFWDTYRASESALGKSCISIYYNSWLYHSGRCPA